MRVLVFEPDFLGHHFAYLHLVLPALAEVADTVVLATSASALTSTQYRLFLEPLSCEVEIDTLPQLSGGRVLTSARRVRSLVRSVKRVRPDHVIIPYADGIAQFLGAAQPLPLIHRDVQVEGLMFRGAFAYPSRSLRRRAFTLASWRFATRAPWDRMHVLDPLVLAEVRRQAGRLSDVCDLMPDPVTRSSIGCREGARRRLGVREDGRYIACVGALDRRKGVDLLIRAFASANLPATDRLLLVGPQEPCIAEMLRGDHFSLVRSGRICSFDRFVSQQEFDDAIVAADVVCTPYPEHVGSASIVIRGAAAGRFVLGSDAGWIGDTVKRFALGRVCRATDQSDFAHALEASLELAPQFALGRAGQRFVEFHSPANFMACWTSFLRGRLGMPEAPGRLTWEWVLEALTPSAADPA